MYPRNRQHRMRRLAAGVAAATAAAATLGASPAQAGIEVYCDVWQGGYASCVGPRHSMNHNVVRSGVDGGTSRVCAGARDGYTYAFVGSFLCGGGYRCRPTTAA
jgi:hypothetical protein